MNHLKKPIFGLTSEYHLLSPSWLAFTAFTAFTAHICDNSLLQTSDQPRDHSKYVITPDVITH